MIDIYLNKVLACLMKHYGVDQAYRDIDPLTWYINTGRASALFLRSLVSCKPFMIARKLHEGGSVQDAVDRIKTYVSSQTELLK